MPRNGEHLEDNLVQVERDLLVRDPEKGDPTAVGHHGERVAQRPRIAGHLEDDVVALDHAELAHHVAQVAFPWSTAIVAPIRIASSRRNGLGSETTT